jgi:tetraacyldisaccharide 4'-kinase
VIILDDAFQHRRIYRDLDIVLVDATNPWGNGQLLPAGPLREPRNSLKRAHVVILTRAAERDYEEQLCTLIRKNWNKPVYAARHKPVDWVGLMNGERLDLGRFRGARALVFGGIGNFRAFVETVRSIDIKVIAEKRFQDHYWYKEEDIRELENMAAQYDTEILLTTEKDSVRISRELCSGKAMYYLCIEFEILNDEEKLIHFIISHSKTGEGAS